MSTRNKAVDFILSKIQSDQKLQESLKTLATYLHNRNLSFNDIYWLENKEVLTEALNLVKSYVVTHQDTLLDPDAASSDDCDINYSSVLFFAQGQDEKLTVEKVSKSLVPYLLHKYFPGIDDYVEAFGDSTILERFKLSVDEDGLINLNDSRIKIKRHGLQLDGTELIYLHQFLRRYMSGNFVHIPSILSSAIEKGYEVWARIDPLRSAKISDYREIFEADHWFGPEFDPTILSSKDEQESLTVHGTNWDSDIGKLQSLSYPIERTHFRSSMMDSNLRQFSVEEYFDLASSRKQHTGKKYHVQKFSHFVYDQSCESFEHIDGAVRVFGINEYQDLFQTVMSGKNPDRRNGTRYKLFKISGNITTEFIQETLHEHFRGNHHIAEYFSGMTAEEVFNYMKNHRD